MTLVGFKTFLQISVLKSFALFFSTLIPIRRGWFMLLLEHEPTKRGAESSIPYH